MSWLRKLICGPCACGDNSSAEPMVSEEVSPSSPARLLAKSLTDPETRDEWRRAIREGALSSEYRNEKRDLTISRWWVPYYGGGISTPFTLNKTEEKVVIEALIAWSKHRSDLAEQAALARLTKQLSGKREA